MAPGRSNTPFSSFLLNSGEVSTAGAFVLQTNRGMVTIKVVMDLDTTSAFEPEVLSLLIAHEIARDKKVDIWTDCQAAIKTLNGGNLGPLSYTLSGWTKARSVSFKKVSAHPEKRKEISEWLPEERGNFLADQIAGDVVPPMFTISASKWLSMIAENSKVLIK